MTETLNSNKVLVGTLVVLYQFRKELSKTLCIPFIVYCALDFAHLIVTNIYAGFFALLIGWATHTIFAITTHRTILLGPKSVPEWGLRKWTKRETFFAIHFLLVVLCTIPAAVLQLVPLAGIILAPLVALWITSRISLVFPAIAVDQGLTIPKSWNLSKKHQFPLLICAAAFPLLFAIPIFLLSHLPYGSVFVSFFATLLTVFTFASMSLAYREIYRIEFNT